MAFANRLLALMALAATVICVIYLFVGVDRLVWDLRPGSPIGQSIGIASGLILLGTLCYIPVRRSDAKAIAKPAAQNCHALVGILGVTLAIVHSQFALKEWSALVLLTTIGLLASGLYGRLIAPLTVGTTFGRHAIPYATAVKSVATSDPLREIIRLKRNVLHSLDATAYEHDFVLRWHHWTRHPGVALRYYRLSLMERQLLARHPLSGAQLFSRTERYWRAWHLWLALLFLIGLIAHVVTTVFFADYVADGSEVYWWHMTR